MARPLTPADLEAKNRLHDDEPWIWFLEVSLPTFPETRYRLVNNSHALDFGTFSTGAKKTYTPFPFAIGQIEADSNAVLNRFAITTTNATLEVQAAFENYDMMGQTVRVMLAHRDNLESGAPAVDYTGEILNFSDDENGIAIEIGKQDLLRRNFPPRRMSRFRCGHLRNYGGPRCGYNVNRGPNLIGYSEDFTNAYWTEENTGVTTASITIAPDGAGTGNRLDDNDSTSGNYYKRYRDFQTTLGVSYVASVFAKLDSSTDAFFRFGGADNLRFDPTDGTIGIVNSSTGRYGVIADEASWYRYWMHVVGDGGTKRFEIQADRRLTGTSSTFFWGAMVNLGDVPLGYQKTTTAITPALQSCDGTYDGPNGCVAHGDDEVAAGLARLHPQRFGAYRGIARRGGLGT